MKKNLIIPEIPEEIIELYVAYNKFRNQIIDMEYKNITMLDKQMLDKMYYKVINKIDDSLEEFQQKKYPLLNRTHLWDFSSFKSGLESIQSRKKKMIEMQNYAEATRIGNKEQEFINKNRSDFNLMIDNFKNQCANLIDENVYVLYSFITIFINDILFMINMRFKSREIKDILRDKYYLEIERKIGRMRAISIKRKELEFNLRLIKLLNDF